jgi:ribosome modulation factor
MIELDEYQLERLAFAEGFDDGIKGDNYNPYDELTHQDEWKSYENGYLQGVMDGWTGA